MMRRTVLFVLISSFAALGQARAQHGSASRTGWVSDEACGAEHTKPGRADCVEKCWRGGAAVGHPEWKPQRAVFVTDDDHFLWVVLNAEAVKDFPAAHVELAGKFDHEKKTVQVEKVTRMPGEQRPEAMAFLKEVCRRYEHLSSYHIESVEEWQTNGDFSREWSKSIANAIVASGNRYRFERHERGLWWVQISNGKNEWVYQPSSQEYTQQPTPASEPSRFKNPFYQELNKAQDMPKSLSRWPTLIRSAVYLPDEIIDLNGSPVDCYVIEAQTKRPGANVTSKMTFWVDRDTKVFRKVREYDQGPVIANEPYENYVSDRIVLYPVADLEVSAAPDTSFAFNPPSTAKLVKEFQDPMHRAARLAEKDVVGQAAPLISLHSVDGTTVSLKSFQGKPVLLDFWATWCGPCLDSMPLLEKLYRKTSNKGLVMLSIDEDEDAKEALDYLAEHPEPWPNFHGSDDVINALPHLGIPYLVLVDASGKIVFTGSRIEELRDAVAKLGPDFAFLADVNEP